MFGLGGLCAGLGGGGGEATASLREGTQNKVTDP